MRAVVLGALCFVFLQVRVLQARIVLPVQVEGNSMFPTYPRIASGQLCQLAWCTIVHQRLPSGVMWWPFASRDQASC